MEILLLLEILRLLLLEILEPLLLHWPSPPCIGVDLHLGDQVKSSEIKARSDLERNTKFYSGHLVDTDSPSLLVARLLSPHSHPLPLLLLLPAHLDSIGASVFAAISVLKFLQIQNLRQVAS